MSGSSGNLRTSALGLICLAGLVGCQSGENIPPDIVLPTPEMVLAAQKRGEAIQRMILDAEQVELVSVDPLGTHEIPNRPPAIGELDRFKVIGRSLCQSRAEIQKLADALGRSVSEGKFSAMCFFPRHALILKSGDRATTILICFHCSNYRIGKEGSPLNADLAEPTFETIFQAHGLPKVHIPGEGDGARKESKR